MTSKTDSAISPSLVMSGDSLREAFGKALVKFSQLYPDFVVFDADVAGGTGVHHFRSAVPERFFQFGIAEQNMMSAAAGFAATGGTVFVTTFAVFAIRAIEQARLSIAFSNRNVKIVASHPGLDVGPDGASAQALEDIAMFRSIPGMTVISPADPTEMEMAVEALMKHDGPVYMRSGRSSSKKIFDVNHTFEIGKGQVLIDGSDLTIIACGVEVARALEASEFLASKNISAAVINMHTIKPLDTKLIELYAEKTGCFVSAEDHSIVGGLGSAIAEHLAKSRPCPMEFIGTKDCFGESGEPDGLAEKYGLTAPHIVSAAIKVLARKTT